MSIEKTDYIYNRCVEVLILLNTVGMDDSSFCYKFVKMANCIRDIVSAIEEEDDYNVHWKQE